MQNMNVGTAIHQRTAVRAFERDYVMADGIKRRLLELAMQAPSAWKRNPARYFDAADDDVADVLGAKVIEFYTDRDWLARDEAMRSCGLAAQTLMLATTEMGLASYPMDIFEADTVKSLLNLPQGHETAMFVAIGKAKADQGMDRMGRLPYDEIVTVDRFPAP